MIHNLFLHLHYIILGWALSDTFPCSDFIFCTFNKFVLQSVNQSVSHSLTHSFIYSVIQSLLNYPTSLSVIQSLNQSFTHSFAHFSLLCLFSPLSLFFFFLVGSLAFLSMSIFPSFTLNWILSFYPHSLAFPSFLSSLSFFVSFFLLIHLYVFILFFSSYCFVPPPPPY